MLGAASPLEVSMSILHLGACLVKGSPYGFCNGNYKVTQHWSLKSSSSMGFDLELGSCFGVALKP